MHRETTPSQMPAWESLESRQLLSASVVMHPNLALAPAASGYGFQGYSPSQISQAYGFNQVSADGAGQTIAIVDAFNDPNIASDLHTFDQKFGLSDPASLKIVSQTGGSVSSLPRDSGWASEIALDVEWAHAIAPKANILLVEANSDGLGDLMAGVDYARHAAGVSVVSMSWGGNEFYGQTQYDNLFTTPAGHNGVTFVAASGDSGSWWGPQWPASSPNVLAVGGTTLLTSNSSGTYAAEYGWGGSGGGISSIESEPAYQKNAQNTGGRTTPDVAYDANPATGFLVYSSVPDQGASGWAIVGGTSAGAPQWAALVALADQVRAASGKGSLDGASGTLPTLYDLYGSGGTTRVSAYLASFHDVVQGRSSFFLGAHAGYDGVTGLGSPKAAMVVAALAGAGSSSAAAQARLASAVRMAKPAVVSGARPAPAVQSASPATAPVSPQASSPAPAMAQATAAVSTPSVQAAAVGSSTLIAGNAVVAGHEQLAVGDVVTSAVQVARAVFSASTEGAAFNEPLTPVTVVRQAGAAVQAAVPHLAAEVAEVALSAVPAVQAPVLALTSLGQLNAAMAFSDAIAEFAHESAAVGTVLGSTHSHSRAWATTIAVLGADAILVGYFYSKRRRQFAGSGGPPTRTFMSAHHIH